MPVETQTDRNYEAFQSMLPKLLLERGGEYVLLHDCEVVGFFPTSLEATITGARDFGLGNFSVQEVSDSPEHLGFYSYVGGAGAA